MKFRFLAAAILMLASLVFALGGQVQIYFFTRIYRIVGCILDS
jgi:hypothetical protein